MKAGCFLANFSGSSMKRNRAFNSVFLLIVLGLVTGCNSDGGTLYDGDSEPIREIGGSPVLPPSGDLSVSPLLLARSATISGKRAVPMDFQEVLLEISIDNSSNVSTGVADIAFISYEDGYPYFLLDGTVVSARLNGASVSIVQTQDPDSLNSIRMVQLPVKAGANNRLELSYELTSDAVSYRADGIGLVTAMADIDDGNFFEAYGPANFEDDQFRMKLRVNLIGVSSAHQFFTNGRLTELGGASWDVDFPAYFNSSAFYFHVTDTALAVRTGNYEGLTKNIPLTVYAADAASADSAMNALPGLFKELESAYGPYLHESFTAYISGSGGMEHCGATITSLSALGHELTHSWFGRGILPGGGASGWFDESIASWRDYGYQRASGTALRSATNLATLSKFERFTPYNSYADGRTLMGEFDYLLAGKAGGLRAVLKEFFAMKKSQIIQTQDFLSYLASRSGQDLGWMFDRYVFGKSSAQAATDAKEVAPDSQPSMHPPALTRDDIERLR